MKVENFYDLLCFYCQSRPRAPNQSIQDYIRYLWSIPDLYKAKLDQSDIGRKSASLSAEFRGQGNNAYVKSDYSSALAFYNKAVLHAPKSECLALAYGNRSAVLYQTGEYLDSLKDIKSAIKHGYPKEKRLKLCERRAACYEVLGDHRRALATCKDALENNERCEMLSKIEEKLAALNLKSMQKKFKNTFYAEKVPWKPVPVIAEGTHSGTCSMSSAMELKVNKTIGRHYVATHRDIEPGETVLIEKPFIHMPTTTANLTHCTNCMKCCIAPMPCRSCTMIVFCGETCEKDAWETFHRLECVIIPHLKLMTDHLARNSGIMESNIEFPPELRMLTKVGAKLFVKERGKVDLRPKKGSERFFEASDSFEALTELMWNEADGNEFPGNAIMILKLMQLTSFFDELSEDLGAGKNAHVATGAGAKATSANKSQASAGANASSAKNAQQKHDFEVYVCTMLHVLHLISKVNTKIITEYDLIDECGPDRIRRTRAVTKNTGTCIFIRANMFNHSCYPNVIKLFHGGNTGVFRALRSIAKGDELTIAYHFQSYDMIGLEMRSTALGFLDFMCLCQACAEKWPITSKVPRKVICPGCKTLLPETAECCHVCHKTFPVLQALMELGSTELAYHQALQYFDRTGAHSDFSIGMVISRLKKLEATFAPPNDEIMREICVLKSHFLDQGNCYDKRHASKTATNNHD